MKILQGALLAATLLTLCSCAGGSSGKHPARAKKHFDEGRYENAQVEYRKALQSEPKRAEIWRELGLTYMKQSKPEQAHESFNQALVLRPDDVDAARDLAQLLLPAYWQSGHKAKPLGDRLDKLAEILLRNEAGSFMGNRVRGHLAVGARQPEKAIQHFQAALRGKPGDADSDA